MVRAEQKKNENISEYIIHLYKTEDLLRTFEFDLNRINSQAIANIPVSNNEKKELILWYANLIEAMKIQKIEKFGHLNVVNDLISQLTSLHSSLLLNNSDYKAIVSKAEPYIKEQIKTSNQTITNPIQICLNAIYGFLMLKLEGKTVTPNQQKMLEHFGDLLSFLSFKYEETHN